MNLRTRLHLFLGVFKAGPKVLLIRATTVCIIIGIGAGYYFWLHRINSNQSATTTSSTTASKTTSADKTAWVDYKDNRGFAVTMPKGWTVNVNDWGLIKMGPEPTSADKQMALALTMVYSSDKTSAQVIADLKAYFGKSFTNFKIADQKTNDKYSSTLCKITYTGSDMVGVLNVNGSGKNYYVSGFVAPSAELKDAMPNLMKTIASFNYDKTLRAPDKVTGLTQMVSWKDPTEGAFTVDVPKGWTTDGSVVRPYIDAAIKINVVSGDKGIHVENPYPPIYTVPNQVLDFSGFKEGSHYNPSGGVAQDMIVASEKTAQDYIKTTLATALSLTVQSVSARDDLVAKIPKTSYVSQVTAAEATLTGDGKTHKVIIIEQGITISGITIWYVGLTHYWAPASDLAEVEQIATAMDQSFKIDATWAKNEQVQVAKRSQIISQSASDISDIISSTFDYRSASQDKLSEKWSDAILGVQDVYDPTTGDNYTVPNTSNHYWTDGLNTVIGTDTSQNPGNYWDWHELTPVE